MNAERVTNNTLNRQGWFWAVKFDNEEQANTLISTLPYGTKQYNFSKKSARPHWVDDRYRIGVHFAI